MLGLLRVFVTGIWLLSLYCACSAQNLNEEYRFSTDLTSSYKLHWTFDLRNKTISFAVNVSTTGWVGLGLSPNGQMPGSDVVIGWVEDNGQVKFKDRFAASRAMPTIDASQDWFLVSGTEDNGYTILEFTRNLTSCDDDNDLDIKADTSKVIWSYHSNDPVSENTIQGHESKGSTSLYLLGGLPEERIESNSTDFVVDSQNLTIPAVDTTYWCLVTELPPEIRQQERYIYKLSPEISEGGAPFVHHIVIYLCAELNNTFLGASSLCSDTHVDIGTCRSGNIIAAWAVGGTDFVFPEDVALALGGVGAPRYLILEVHFDNPTLQSGAIDNSGIRFSYTNTPSLHRAGLLLVGAHISPALVIPPGADDFIISTFCPRACTQAHFPPQGITVFGNLLHTHLAGHGLVVKHLRENDQCGLLEELMPIDENRRYDFNFQQFTILPREIQILPGDEIQLQCFYRTSDPSYTQVTLGGESTRDEMCLSFMYYYPQTDLAICTSAPELQTYQTFARPLLNSSMLDLLSQSLTDNDINGVRTSLNDVEWTQDAIYTLQSLLLSGPHSTSCVTNSDSETQVVESDRIPMNYCAYNEPDTCSGQDTQRQQCCDSGFLKIGYNPLMIHTMWTILAFILL